MTTDDSFSPGIWLLCKFLIYLTNFKGHKCISKSHPKSYILFWQSSTSLGNIFCHKSVVTSTVYSQATVMSHTYTEQDASAIDSVCSFILKSWALVFSRPDSCHLFSRSFWP